MVNNISKFFKSKCKCLLLTSVIAFLIGCSKEIKSTDVYIVEDSVQLELNSIMQLTGIVVPIDSDDDVIWTSQDLTVASVNKGELTGVGIGETTIVISSNGISDSCHVEIFEPKN